MTSRRRLARLCLAMSCLAASATTFDAEAGQGWYVNMKYAAPVVEAKFSGTSGINCWYINDFANRGWAIPAAGIQKYTEEDWSVFGCGGGKNNYVQLNFSVTTVSPPKTGSFAFLLVDTGTGAYIPAGWQSTTCSTDGKGEATAIGWKWTDGNEHPPVPQAATCSMSNGTVTANLTLPPP